MQLPASGSRVLWLLRVHGLPMDRQPAARVVVRLAKKAGIKKHLSSHSLRDALTAGVDAGTPCGMCRSPRHSDPRMTSRYDRLAETLGSRQLRRGRLHRRFRVDARRDGVGYLSRYCSRAIRITFERDVCVLAT
jgi:hypothetical protein